MDDDDDILEERILEIIVKARAEYQASLRNKAAAVFEEIDRVLPRAFRMQDILMADKSTQPFARFSESWKGKDKRAMLDNGEDEVLVVTRSRARERSVDEPFTVRTIPEIAPLPQYKCWGYLLQNEQAQEVGRRQFYTDAPTGETIPASDDEAEQQPGDAVLSGAFWEREDFVLLQLSRSLTIDTHTLGLIAEVLQASVEKVDARMREAIRLAEGRPGAAVEGAARASNRALSEVLTGFQTAFCRRCRVYSCVKHKDGIPTPHEGGTLAVDRSPSTNPCGPMCWQTQSLSSAQPPLTVSRNQAQGSEPASPGQDGRSVHSLHRQNPSGNPQGLPPAASHSTNVAKSGLGSPGAKQPRAATATLRHTPGPGGASSPSAIASASAAHANPAPSASPSISARPSTSAASPLGGGPLVASPELGAPTAPAPFFKSSPPAAAPSRPSGLGLGLPPRPKPPMPVRAPLGLGGLTLFPSRKKRTLDEAGDRAPAAASGGSNTSAASQPPPIIPGGVPQAADEQSSGAAARDAAPPQVGGTSGQAGEPAPAAPPAAGRPKGKVRPEILLPVKPVHGPLHRRLKDSAAPGLTSPGLMAVPARRRSAPSAGPASATEDALWTDFEASLVAKGVDMYGRNPCRIARLLPARSCREIGAYLQQNASLQPAEVESADAPPGPKKGKPGKSKMAAKLAVARHRFDGNDLWSEYRPCTCKGQCDDSCPCFMAKNYCDKFCGCSLKCTLRHPGCKCTSGCKSRTCPCLASGRECDPDLCLNCCMWGDATDGIPNPARVCANMYMLMRQHKRIAVGLSDVSGWGAFVLEDVKKNELVGEYTGELIGHDEAERRGKAYDRDNNSYLFNLNTGLVIDARQRGNKLRYANHGDDANCRAEILLVGGDHRVGIYAIKDIPRGSELTYNYHYDRLFNPPSWVKKRRRPSDADDDVAVTAMTGGR